MAKSKDSSSLFCFVVGIGGRGCEQAAVPPVEKHAATLRPLISVLITAGIFMLSGLGSAEAMGTVRVQQSDNSVQLYHNASIEISNKTLRITTADKKGTLVIDEAACSFVGEVMRCLPYSMTLDQGGGAYPLDFQRGTAYLNLTDTRQPLPLTSKQLPPRSIMLSLTTKIGTIVDVTGAIDGEIK